MDTHPKHLPADERRAVTVEAVVELAGSVNPSEITTAAIAKHMNLTQGALFRHFPTKDAIWQAVMEWVAERLLAGSTALRRASNRRWPRCRPCS
jgi:TetR/AcrR family transcriptional regulator